VEQDGAEEQRGDAHDHGRDVRDARQDEPERTSHLEETDEPHQRQWHVRARDDEIGTVGGSAAHTPG
jgi:hypothetical protein